MRSFISISKEHLVFQILQQLCFIDFFEILEFTQNQINMAVLSVIGRFIRVPPAGLRKQKKVSFLRLAPMAGLRACAMAGADLRRAHKTVPAAVTKSLASTGLWVRDMDLIEVQEAFAAQVLADLQNLGIGPEAYSRVNVNGSGISLGHPIACTGTRVLVSLLYEMQRSQACYALECIYCDGLGIAVVLERH
jgi:acetyl-CoA C-acetyltransferase